MEKLYDRIDWNNNTSPALNETNLNLMSKAIDDIDDRVVNIAGTVMETVPQIQEDLADAQELVEDAQALTTHPPIIGQNGNWWTWNTATDAYVDSGVDAGVSLSIGSTATLPAGSNATVTNVGTATDPVLNFGIPKGPKGDDGVGIPTGGTIGQVLKKKSGTDYDTEWGEDSAGHTILNGSGSALTQRSKLQFVGADVVDDGTNDKTIITTTPQSMIGDAWVSGHAYAAGDYAIDANGLYKNSTTHTSTATNRPSVNQSGYWTLVSVESEIKSIKDLFVAITIKSGSSGFLLATSYGEILVPFPGWSGQTTSGDTTVYVMKGRLLILHGMFQNSVNPGYYYINGTTLGSSRGDCMIFTANNDISFKVNQGSGDYSERITNASGLDTANCYTSIISTSNGRYYDLYKNMP